MTHEEAHPDPAADTASHPIDELLAAADGRRATGDRPTQGGQEFQIIRFRTGGRDFAVPIDRVERTERVPRMTSVPRCPPFVRGVASLRGEVVCVLDLRSFLSGEDGGEEAKSLLVITDGTRRVGVLCENLPDFERIQSADTMDIPATELEIYAGAVERRGQLVGILDPVKLFDHIERRMVHAGG